MGIVYSDQSVQRWNQVMQRMNMNLFWFSEDGFRPTKQKEPLYTSTTQGEVLKRLHVNNVNKHQIRSDNSWAEHYNEELGQYFHMQCIIHSSSL